MRFYVLILVLLFLPAPAGAQAPSGTAALDLPRYLAELDRLRAELSQAQDADAARAVVSSLPDRWWVTADGQVTIVDTRWISADVERALSDRASWPSIRQRITGRLTTMRAAAAEPAVAAGAAVDAALQEVLTRPEFHRTAASRWLEDQRNRFSNWLLSLLNRLSGGHFGGRRAAVALAWAVSIAALAALGWWLVAMLTRRSQVAGLDLGPAPPHRPPAREWALRALAAARAGDLREAVRCGYHAALCRIEENGTWRVDESRTPREYLSLLPADDPRRPALADLTRRFEVIWYGRRVGTGDDVRRMSAHLERLGCLRESDHTT